ncbi:MAG: ion transporter [Mycoplasma sp.]|nr:ion transporter [Mycoplasma sp.]
MFKNWSNTNYSREKEYINAIVMSDARAFKKAKKRKTLKTTAWLYAFFIAFVILISLLTLFFSIDFQKNYKTLFTGIEILVFLTLALDYVLRWWTSEVRFKKGNWSYFYWPFSFSAIILLFSLLPSFYLINIFTSSNITVFTFFENLKFLRVFRLILLLNLFPFTRIFVNVFTKEKRDLTIVFVVVMATIAIFALIMYNIEGISPADIPKNLSPSELSDWKAHHITTFWDAFYFSTVTLTTIGFGDIVPVTGVGRTMVIMMSVIGIGVLAIPSGIIAGGFISEVKRINQKKAKAKEEELKRKAKK